MTDTTVRATDEPSSVGDRLVRWFADTTLADADVVGGKGANLGELTRHGLPVPPGFTITTMAYFDVLEASGSRATLRELMAGVDPSSLESTAERAARARTVIAEVTIPPEVRAAVLDAWAQLQAIAPGPVAVRSSAAGEDSETASFAGMNETFTNVSGPEELLDRLRRAWMSIYGERVITYRAVRDMTAEPAIAVVVQHMARADRAGVMFTADPTDLGKARMVIEAAWGQGEVVVGGQVEPDTYLVDRHADGALSVAQARIGTKAFEIVAGPDGRDLRRDVGADRARARALDDATVIEIARLGLATEAAYGSPQDIEWCTEGDRIWLVQSRPITTGSPGVTTEGTAGDSDVEHAGAELLRGLAASHGRGSGPARLLGSTKEGDRLQPGDVLVTVMTKPDWLPLMRRAVAVVTDGGGITCHAAIVARELGIPCVVGTRTATTTLRDGEVVTVDADRGTVLSGASAPVTIGGAPGTVPSPTGGAAAATGALATRILVNLALTEEAATAAALPVDGVGLLRAELLVTDALAGRHPRALLEAGGAEEFVTAMSGALATIGGAFGARPVIYRAIDFRTNEFRELAGGETIEPVEANPMIGYRGCFRYLSEPDLFGLELEALARARETAPNIHLMIPFVRTAWELEGVFAQVDASPLRSHRDLQRWIMAEVPSVVAWIPTYAGLGVHGVSIGSNDLTQLMLGVDRDSELVARLFDETDLAVLVVRPGAVPQPGLRRAPRPLRDRLDLGGPRRRAPGARDRRRRGGSGAARGGAPNTAG
jgi:pyruvate,water dikinase